VSFSACKKTASKEASWLGQARRVVTMEPNSSDVPSSSYPTEEVVTAGEAGGFFLNNIKHEGRLFLPVERHDWIASRLYQTPFNALRSC